MTLTCANCSQSFTDRKVGRNVCPWCGHVHLRRTATERTLAIAASKGNGVRRVPSLAKVSILEDKD